MGRIMDVDSSLIYLEVLMLNEMYPIFLQVDYQQEFLYIFIVCDYFKNYSISERIESIFSLMKFDCPEILSSHSVIVEALSDVEFDQFMKDRNERKVIKRKK